MRWCLPTVRALNQRTPLHIYAHAHTRSFHKQESCAVVMETRPPPPLSPPLISSSTLHDSLQSVNLELSPHDAIPGTVTGGGIKQRERGEVGAGGGVWLVVVVEG